MADKAKALKELTWTDKTGLTLRQPMRMMKLIQPRCSTCKPTGPGWWARCPHNAYHSMQAIEDPQGKMTFNTETGNWEEDPSKKQVIREYVLIANVAQIPLSIRVGGGREVDKALANGYKFPEDVEPQLRDGTKDPEFDGYAPMCEFQNCYSPNPKIKTKHSLLESNREVDPRYFVGHYCTERHAKAARLKDQEMYRYVASANEASAASARAQYDAIVL